MKSKKDFNRWIDQSISRFMKLTDGPNGPKSSDIQHYDQDEDSKQDENELSMFSDEQVQLTNYFERLRNAINNYEEQVLFESTEIRNELLNIIKDDYHIVKLRIEVKPVAKIKEFKKHIFVKEIYAKSG